MEEKVLNKIQPKNIEKEKKIIEFEKIVLKEINMEEFKKPSLEETKKEKNI